MINGENDMDLKSAEVLMDRLGRRGSLLLGCLGSSASMTAETSD